MIPAFKDAPRLAPWYLRPLIRRRIRKAERERDRLIFAALDLMEVMYSGDQFEVCISRLKVLIGCGAISPDMMEVATDELRRLAWKAERR